EDASKQGRNDDPTKEYNLDIEADAEVIVEDKGSGEKGGSTTDQVSIARPEVSATTLSTPPTTTNIFDVKETPRLARSTTTLKPLLTIDLKDKGKGVLVEEEPVKVKRGLAQIESDVELAQRIHEEELAELDRVQKEREMQEEATYAALGKEFDKIQARMDADHELAARLTCEEQEKYTIKEIDRLLAEFFERRKKQLAAERAEAIRNKPPTRTQVRNKMITYLKHIAESTKKRSRANSKKESSKKQKLEEENDVEKEELRANMDIVPRDDIAINVESLATKVSSHQEMLEKMLNWKIEAEAESTMAFELLKFIKQTDAEGLEPWKSDVQDAVWFRMLVIRIGKVVVPELLNRIQMWNGMYCSSSGFRPRRRDLAITSDSFVDCSKEKQESNSKAEEFNLMDAAADLDENNEVNATHLEWLFAEKHRLGTQLKKLPSLNQTDQPEYTTMNNRYDHEIF
ncbi:hypothetical protein Tco_0318882, partial [Tanacetum coccineum]